MGWHELITAIAYAAAVAWIAALLIERVPTAQPVFAVPRCAHCAAAFAWYEQFPLLTRLLRRGRCRACGAELGWRGIAVEAACFAAALAVAVSYAQGATRLAWFAFVPLAVALAFIDLQHKRLPDLLTLPTWGGALLLLGVDAVLQGVGFRWVWALEGSAALFALYLLMNLLTRGGMGMGDVKLALAIGAFTGYLGAPVVVLATLVAFLLAGVTSAGLLLTHRATRSSSIPFGPFMLVGAFVALVLVYSRVDCLWLGCAG